MHPIHQTLRQINRLRRTSYGLSWLIRIARAIVLSFLLVGLWTLIVSEDEIGQLILLVVGFVSGILFSSKNFFKALKERDFLTYLEMKYPEEGSSAFGLKEENTPLRPEWENILAKEKKLQRKIELRKLVYLLSTLPLPLMLLFTVQESSQQALANAVANINKIIAKFNRGGTMTILSGLENDDMPNQYQLDGDPVTLELLEDNMIEITIVGSGGSREPVIELREPQGNNAIFQSFRMGRSGNGKDEENAHHTLAFAVDRSAQIWIPSFSGSPVAQIAVKKLPVPTVNLSSIEPIKDYWPDDKPLPLKIDVKAENPLQLVRLVIETEGRKFSELVNNIVATDMRQMATRYELALESYVQSEISELVITAEALDRSVPQPLLGRSESLIVKTMSAYGRYLNTLNLMKETKQQAEEILQGETKKPRLEKMRELAEKFAEEADESPFFDGLDRVNIQQFKNMIEGMEPETDSIEYMRLADEMNNFLFEHEILNDRERDRDFFVAARALSRMLSDSKTAEDKSIDPAINRMRNFLEQRHERWEKRVEQLGSDRPEQWNEIKTEPFDKSMERIQAHRAQDPKQSTNQNLSELSDMVVKYRTWIDQLEQAEDQKRQKEEQERQDGLANAQEALKELQQRQGDISAKLDHADRQPKEQMSQQWPSMRMDQNSNMKDAASLQAQLQTLSPLAGERIKAAREAMKFTVEAGNGEQFSEAESGSDMAGRLLRQARSEAQKSQNEQQRRGRRRRISGDNYYGSQVVGGDVEIKRAYEVNRRYREDILDEVQRSDAESSAEEQRLLENYLRKVIR
jgi:hypothetical protein